MKPTFLWACLVLLAKSALFAVGQPRTASRTCRRVWKCPSSAAGKEKKAPNTNWRASHSESGLRLSAELLHVGIKLTELIDLAGKPRSPMCSRSLASPSLSRAAARAFSSGPHCTTVCSCVRSQMQSLASGPIATPILNAVRRSKGSLLELSGLGSGFEANDTRLCIHLPSFRYKYLLATRRKPACIALPA